MSEDEVFVAESEWRRHFDKWFIVDCKIRTNELVYLLLREIIATDSISLTGDHEIGVRMVQIDLGEPDGGRELAVVAAKGFDSPVAGVSRKPLVQELLISANADGSAFARGGGQRGDETAPAIVPARIKCLDGYAYAVGGNRKILKRTDAAQWQPFNREGFPPLQTAFRTASEGIRHSAGLGFNDIDGPSERLLYAVGGKGDVWRYENQRWQQCAFPSNEQLGTVTVAGDGNVHISGEAGNLWVGEKDDWRLLERGNSSLLYNDSAWHRGELWLCSDYQLRVLKEGKLERPKFGEQDLHMAGHMDAYGDQLLIAGGGSAWLFDGRQWRCLVAPYA